MTVSLCILLNNLSLIFIHLCSYQHPHILKSCLYICSHWKNETITLHCINISTPGVSRILLHIFFSPGGLWEELIFYQLSGIEKGTEIYTGLQFIIHTSP